MLVKPTNMSYNNNPSKILTAVGPVSRKRKEKDVFYPVSKKALSAQAEPDSSNRLLAGYLAYEFLTKGTLFGEVFDPSRADAKPLKMNNNKKQEFKPREQESYAEVASVLKSGEAHLPGVVNPAQLARWIKM